MPTAPWSGELAEAIKDYFIAPKVNYKFEKLRQTTRQVLRLTPPGPLVTYHVAIGAISSVVERLLHTQEVAGSNPASRTILCLVSRRHACI